MSYILDALRRADAERARGGVPGLHAQAHAGDAFDEPRRRGGAPWAGIAIALGLTLLVVLLWLTFAPAGPAPEPVAPSPIPAPPAPVAPAPAPVAAAEPATTHAAPAAAPIAPPATTLPALPPPTPVPVARAAVAKAEPAPPRAAASTPAAEPRIPALRELPEELRRQIPPLNVGGSTWSANAASRFVILNGQLLRENDPVNPELALKQIRQRSLILEFRGQRFEFGF